MVGQWTATKPSRSDEVLDADQQQEISNRVRAQFDSLAPKRPAKPNRSEPQPDSDSSSILTSVDQDIPELDKLRSLQSQSQSQSHVKIILQGHSDVVQDEFVETQYYKEMNSIDKDHHTTGTGFIRVVREGEEGNNGDGVQLETGQLGAASVVSRPRPRPRPVFRSNPATNDWIPNVDDDQVYVSSKPNRSEGC